MNPILLTAIIILALAATAQYYLGMKQNRVYMSGLTKELEEALRPASTNYVNIGGAIGHNFAYGLSSPWTNAKGTITLSPRQSLFYMPISRLLGHGDRFFMNLFTKRKFRGEAHIVDHAHLRKVKIEGIQKMQRREIEAGGRKFTLLWSEADLSSELEALLGALPAPARLRHFCAYAENKTFFLHTYPERGKMKEDLDAIIPRLGAFLEKAKE